MQSPPAWSPADITEGVGDDEDLPVVPETRMFKLLDKRNKRTSEEIEADVKEYANRYAGSCAKALLRMHVILGALPRKDGECLDKDVVYLELAERGENIADMLESSFRTLDDQKAAADWVALVGECVTPGDKAFIRGKKRDLAKPLTEEDRNRLIRMLRYLAQRLSLRIYRPD